MLEISRLEAANLVRDLMNLLLFQGSSSPRVEVEYGPSVPGHWLYFQIEPKRTELAGIRDAEERKDSGIPIPGQGGEAEDGEVEAGGVCTDSSRPHTLELYRGGLLGHEEGG